MNQDVATEDEARESGAGASGHTAHNALPDSSRAPAIDELNRHDREGLPDVAELLRVRNDLANRVEELEALLEILPVGIAISYDLAGKEIRVNAANARLLAVSPDANVSLGTDEARRQPPYRVFDQAGRELAVEELPVQAAVRGAEVRDRVLEILRGDGVRVTLLSYATPLVGTDGRRRGAVAAFVDISALRASELERERLLGELEARHRELEAQAEQIKALNIELEQRVYQRTAELEAIFASVPDALYVVNQHGIIRANQAALESWGAESLNDLPTSAASVVDLMGARYAESGRPIPPEELAVVRALRGERSVQETISRNPKTHRQQMHRSAAAPIVLDGRIAGAVGIATDITEQRRIQRQLAYQANLLDNVNDAIVAYDADLRVTAWNRKAEEQYGWTAEEAIGRWAPEVLGSRMTAEERDYIIQQVVETGAWRGEIKHGHRDGTPLIVETTNMVLHDDVAGGRGGVRGFVTVDRDITQRKQVEAENARLLQEVLASREQLRALSRRLVVMQESERSYVADQLYNQAGQVLAALQLQLALLGKEGSHEPPGVQVSAVTKVPQIKATLNEAIHELHDLASQLRPAALDRSTLARVLQSYAEEFGESHDLTVRFDAGGTENLRLPADIGTAIFRCVQEGLANVARHAQASEIELSLRRDDCQLTVTLSDDGVGFDPANSAAISGLGLASIRERMETVGGRISVESVRARTNSGARTSSGAGENKRPGTTVRIQAPFNNEEALSQEECE